MTDVNILAGDLTASREDRVVSGLLLPYGEVGNTNLGRFQIDGPGIISIPNDVSVLMANEGHSQTEPRARFLTATDTQAGIVASFKVGENPEGDDLLARIEDGKTKGKPMALSVEVKNVVIQAGKAISGAMTGAAFVDRGAFPSAALMASDTSEPEQPAEVEDDADDNGDETTSTETVEVLSDGTKRITRTTVSTTEIIENTNPETEAPVADAIAPTTLAATETASRPLSLTEMSGLLYAAKQGTLSEDGRAKLEANNGDRLFAALSDVKFDGTGGLAPTMTQPQWIGETWSALKYRQQVLPLFSHAALTSLTINGFKWGTKPSGGDWAGNKGDVPSNTLTASAVTATASRYAIGHDIAREFVDFAVPGFFESYAAAVTEDYAKWADAKVAAAVLAGATTLTGDALTTLPGSTGGTIGSAASAIIDGATALVTQGTLPTFALVAPALWKQMVKMPRSNVLGYLNAALGLAEGSLDQFIIRPSASVTAGKVLVGATEAVTVYELPGAPIRIDALDLARGGVDKAAFGYAGVVINDPLGLRLVTAATA